MLCYGIHAGQGGIYGICSFVIMRNLRDWLCRHCGIDGQDFKSLWFDEMIDSVEDTACLVG